MDDSECSELKNLLGVTVAYRAAMATANTTSNCLFVYGLGERRIKKARNALSIKMRRTLSGNEYMAEHRFWRALLLACLKPKSTALGQKDDLANELIQLRNSAIMAVAVANILWIVLINTLGSHKNLNVSDVIDNDVS